MVLSDKIVCNEHECLQRTVALQPIKFLFKETCSRRNSLCLDSKDHPWPIAEVKSFVLYVKKEKVVKSMLTTIVNVLRFTASINRCDGVVARASAS